MSVSARNGVRGSGGGLDQEVEVDDWAVGLVGAVDEEEEVVNWAVDGLLK